MHPVDPGARSPRLSDDLHGPLNGGISGRRLPLRERLHLGGFSLDRVLLPGLPDVLDIISRAITAAFWSGLTTGRYTLTGGQYSIPRRLTGWARRPQLTPAVTVTRTHCHQ
jgi:hypothetical protein